MVSKLCLGGGSFMATASEPILAEALKYDVDFWEIVSFTGNAYAEYFKKNPGARDRIFLSGKVYSTNPSVMQEQLDKILMENQTSVIDFLAVHVIDNIEMMNEDVRKWAEQAKREKKIRFFGFCTHRNIADCLNRGADLGWIDGIQVAYNYRMQGIDSMENALQKCHEKGIGIIAVKSMGLCSVKKEELQKLPLNDERVNSELNTHDLSFEQAKLKAIWQNSSLTSVCSLMSTPEILRLNVEAADEKPLDAEVIKLLEDYAEATGRYYCRRCGQCGTANADNIPIFEIMELLMYARAYGLTDMATKMFARIPAAIRSKISESDFSTAEKLCPQKMPISHLMKEAYAELNG